SDKVDALPDFERRAPIAANHTATHLLNFALREVLGPKVDQKGSLVDEDKLRFDFSHGKRLSVEEVSKVEKIVAKAIDDKLPVYTAIKPIQEARQIPGLRAVFGETYPDPVRVVSIGAPVE